MNPSGAEGRKSLALTIVMALWIFGGAFLFYIRLSYYFYKDNQESIHQAVSEMSQVFGK